MIGQLLQAAFYLAMASAVAWINWHRPTRLSGAALIFYSLISTVAFFTAPFEIILICEIMLASLMSSISWTLWAEGDYPRSHQIVLCLCAVDVAFCGVLCIREDASFTTQMLFSYGTNLIFIGMCAAVAAPGIRDAVLRWIRAIDVERTMDSPTPDFDYLMRQLDRS